METPESHVTAEAEAVEQSWHKGLEGVKTSTDLKGVLKQHNDIYDPGSIRTVDGSLLSIARTLECVTEEEVTEAMRTHLDLVETYDQKLAQTIREIRARTKNESGITYPEITSVDYDKYVVAEGVDGR